MVTADDHWFMMQGNNSHIVQYHWKQAVQAMCIVVLTVGGTNQGSVNRLCESP